MPTYVYGPKPGRTQSGICPVCSAQFETVQRMSDEALTKCPQCGGEVVRLITAPNLGGVGMVRKPSESTLSQAGFTQYKRQGKGYYEKSFGAGPDALHP